ncbi:MAG: hypothetical protein ED859_11325 [Desulfuromonadales bacterium]|nr:MAG: hypothetical protein ED859_11325 [Desulfuromonadales bacterium]
MTGRLTAGAVVNGPFAVPANISLVIHRHGAVNHHDNQGKKGKPQVEILHHRALPCGQVERQGKEEGDQSHLDRECRGTRRHAEPVRGKEGTGQTQGEEDQIGCRRKEGAPTPVPPRLEKYPYMCTTAPLPGRRLLGHDPLVGFDHAPEHLLGPQLHCRIGGETVGVTRRHLLAERPLDRVGGRTRLQVQQRVRVMQFVHGPHPPTQGFLLPFPFCRCMLH